MGWLGTAPAMSVLKSEGIILMKVLRSVHGARDGRKESARYEEGRNFFCQAKEHLDEMLSQAGG
jgi:hypothetical protein